MTKDGLWTEAAVFRSAAAPRVELKCKQRARGLRGFRRESGWKLIGPASSTQRLIGVTGRRAHAKFDIFFGTTGGADRAHEPGRPWR